MLLLPAWSPRDPDWRIVGTKSSQELTRLLLPTPVTSVVQQVLANLLDCLRVEVQLFTEVIRKSRRQLDPGSLRQHLRLVDHMAIFAFEADRFIGDTRQPIVRSGDRCSPHHKGR